MTRMTLRRDDVVVGVDTHKMSSATGALSRRIHREGLRANVFSDG